MTAPMTSREGLLVAGLEQLLAAVHADDPKREILVRIADAIREAKALTDPAQRWQEPAANWLERKADLITNSLHCGDSSMTIHFTHKHADTLRALAKEIRASSSPPSPGLPAPAPNAEVRATARDEMTAAALARIARANLSDPETDDLTVPLAVELAEVQFRLNYMENQYGKIAWDATAPQQDRGK